MNVTPVNSGMTSCIMNSCVCAPLRWVTDKVSRAIKTFFGYIIRIITFQLGEMKVKGAYYVIRIYQKLLSYDPRDAKPFDSQRLEQSKSFLLQYGGVESVLEAEDRNSNVHLITFKSSDFFEKFRNQGSVPIDIHLEGKSRRALLDPPLDAAAKFYFPIINVTMLDGTSRQAALLPEKCPSQNPPHILHCHSPGRSMAMDRKFVGLHLAAGYDVTIWDPRGMAESKGIPSEGGYYQDAEAVFQHLLSKNIDPSRIYVSGFCEGAAIAAYIKKKYHNEGVHLIASNPYTSMKEVVEGYGWLGRLGARYGMQAIQEPNINIPQDYFDNVKKLQNLPSSEGKCIFIHTDTDHMMPKGTVSKLIEAFNHAGPVHEILRTHPNPKENGHLQPPYEDPRVWSRYVHTVT